MANFKLNKGMDIKLAGAPAPQIGDATSVKQVALQPEECVGMKPRLKVKEGDAVKRGTPLVYDKRNPDFQLCSPAGGRIARIELGKRRVLERIVIDLDANEQVESYPKFTADQLLKTDGATLLTQIAQGGLLPLIIARPFSRIANPAVAPKSIFVNGMSTAPYHPDINIVIKGQEAAFQAGLNALTRLTKGKVNLCLNGKLENAPALKDARNVEVHTFTGPHPAGNTSVHIHHIDPISPGDVVWALRAQDVILIGQFLLTGETPATRIITLSGPGIKAGAAQYYKVRIGTPLAAVLKDRLNPGEQRIIGGDILAGTKVSESGYLRFAEQAVTVLPEDKERHFMGWLAPGHNRLSLSRTFVSTWFGWNKTKEWALGTNQRGELRPMVLTGLYDKYLPMNIMVDYLARAVLARDSDEAIALGLLEVDPEDFALCAFACPSKMDLCGIVRKGLDQVEKEGI